MSPNRSFEMASTSSTMRYASGVAIFANAAQVNGERVRRRFDLVLYADSVRIPQESVTFTGSRAQHVALAAQIMGQLTFDSDLQSQVRVGGLWERIRNDEPRAEILAAWENIKTRATETGMNVSIEGTSTDPELI